MKRLTVFDFDGTLTRHDSFTGFIRHVRGLGGLLWVLMKSAPAIILWKTGFRSADYAKLKMFSEAFRGMELEDFRNAGKAYAAKIDAMLKPETVAALEAATSRGDRVVIDSASLGDWIRPWAERHGVDKVIATEAAVTAGGRLTGEFATPNCTHEEKVRRLKGAFPDLAANRSDWHVAAYGDSEGDAALLDFADEPHKIGKKL